MPKAAAKPDGRKLRADESRARIVEAVLALIGEGAVHPSAEAVAARADVGLRSVFRHFKDMESLYAECSARMRAGVAPFAAEPLTGADWRARLGQLLERRADIFERLTPYKIADDAHRAGSAILQAQHAQMTLALRKSLNAVLPPDLRGSLTADAIDLAVSFEAWLRLRRDQGLTVKRAGAVVRHIVDGLIAAGHAKGNLAASQAAPPNSKRQAVV